MLSAQKFLIMRYFTRINATNNNFQSFWKILKNSRLMRLSLERKNGKISWIVDFFTYLFLFSVQNDNVQLFYVKVIYHVISNHILQTFKIKGAAEISKWRITFFCNINCLVGFPNYHFVPIFGCFVVHYKLCDWLKKVGRFEIVETPQKWLIFIVKIAICIIFGAQYFVEPALLATLGYQKCFISIQIFRIWSQTWVHFIHFR